jgi:tyrosine-protein kinase Etk/Wzc
VTYHDILNIILFNIRKILKITILSSLLLFLILLFVYPVTYRAPATILPPENDNQTGSLSSLLSGQDFSGLLTGGLSSANSQLYMEILKSRSAAEYVVREYNLIDYYNEENIYEAANELTKHLNVEINKEGIIKLSVEVSTSVIPLVFDDKDSVKEFAAKLANSYVEALDSINREKLSSKAKRAREYIASELLKTSATLDSVENALMNFQERNKTVALPEQLSAAIDAAAELKAEIMKTEIEIGLLKSNLRADSKELIAIRKKLEQLKEQYNQMELGNKDYLLAFREVPELGKELATLLREVKIQNEVYTMLQQQYYKEKIQENKDLPTVEVLDEAIPPLKATSPRVVFSTIAGGLFVFLLMSCIVILSEKKTLFYVKRNKSE